MLSPLWWLPLIVVAAAVYPLWRGAQRLRQEAAGLEAAIAELRGVRPLVAEVKAEVAAVARAGADGGRGLADSGHR